MIKKLNSLWKFGARPTKQRVLLVTEPIENEELGQELPVVVVKTYTSLWDKTKQLACGVTIAVTIILLLVINWQQNLRLEEQKLINLRNALLMEKTSILIDNMDDVLEKASSLSQTNTAALIQSNEDISILRQQILANAKSIEAGRKQIATIDERLSIHQKTSVDKAHKK